MLSKDFEKLPWESFEKIHVVRRLREIVGKWWKIQINFTDAKGFLRGVPKGRFFNPIHGVCKLITQDKGGFNSCLNDVRQTAVNREKKISLGTCHAGFSTITVPIIVNNQYLGSVFGDGFILKESEEKQKKTIKNTLKKMFPSEKHLDSHVDSLPVLSSSDLNYLTELITMVVDEVLLVHSDLFEATTKIKRLSKELSSRYSLSNITGKSTSMQNLFDLVERVKDSSSLVLILGENGTGKELIAKALHFGSVRKKERFIVVNCGAFNENLLESELFGHVKGAFTGADKDKAGLFEAADEGTLFLDEIGDTSLEMQVKLLRVLQDGTYRPVGSNEIKKTTARIVCATNKDLAKLVSEGIFREDLYYRLNVITLRSPSLRERLDDVPLLIDSFIEKFAIKFATKRKEVSKNCLKELLDYHWPGNVRELENEIERLYVLAGDSKSLSIKDLSERISKRKKSIDGKEFYGTLKEALDKIEVKIIAEGLRRLEGDRLKLSKELGISKSKLESKIEKHKLDRKIG